MELTNHLLKNNNENKEQNERDRSKNISLNIQEVECSTWDGCFMTFLGILLLPTIFGGIFILIGLFTVQPNESAVITRFGKYIGTVKTSGYHWINPFSSVHLVSLRQQNLDGNTLFVNDKRGNPIEIAIVVVWRIVRPVDAIYQVENYHNYIRLQSEAALRHLATSFSYDHAGDENEITLLNGGDVVNKFLVDELNERLKSTGIEVDEARLNHLMYSKQITNVMLKRQQADATIAARKKIVEGATSIVRDTINGLAKDIQFTETQKATMASNLIVILTSETQTQPLMHLNAVSNV